MREEWLDCPSWLGQGFHFGSPTTPKRLGLVGLRGLFPLHPSVLDLALKSVESLMFFLAFSLEIRFAALFLGGGLFLGSALTLFAFAGLPPLFHCAPHSFASLFPGNLS